MRKSIFIFHFRPLENYPPLQNLLHFLNDESDFKSIYCLTTKGKLNLQKIKGKVKLIRCGAVKFGKIRLWFSYVIYNIVGITLLIWKRPKKVIYFESLSAYSVYIYKKYINKSSEIFIHYHEYMDIGEYSEGSLIVRFFHSRERYLYPRVNWISHTNIVRLEKFLNDENLIYNSKTHKTLPNYPPKNWTRENSRWQKGEKLKMVFVGYSLTEESSYLKELLDFLEERKIEVILNLYCIEKSNYIEEQKARCKNVTFILNDAITYSEIPNALIQNHIGLILYKAKTQNYKHNAPNKLFEYLSCGLDVWYPREMEGIYLYDSLKEPRVIRLNYNEIKEFGKIPVIRESEKVDSNQFHAEAVYKTLMKSLSNS